MQARPSGLPPRVLIIEDLPNDAELCEREVTKVLGPCEFTRVETRDAYLAALDTASPDLIISDFKLPHFDGLAALAIALERVPDVPFVILTGSMNEDTAVDCMKAGAWDYVIKEHLKRLGPAVVGVLQQRHLRREKLRADRALRDSEAKYRTIIENTLDVIYTVDRDGTVTYASPRIAMLGYTLEEVVGRSFLEFVHPDDAKRVADEFAKTVETGEEFPTDARAVAKDGSVVFVEEVGRAIRDESGAIVAMLGVVRDVSERKRAEDRLRQALAGTITAVARISEMRDPYTAGHQERVTALACAVAARMGLPRDGQDGLRVASTLHDVGKVVVPAEILSKPALLTPVELALVRTHAAAGFEILKAIDFPWPVAEIVHQHHERMDGSGYPRGLRGGETCLEARILAVADVVEAMASHRPYRPALGVEAALREIAQGAGTLYDAHVAGACQDVFRTGAFAFAAQPPHRAPG